MEYDCIIVGEPGNFTIIFYRIGDPAEGEPAEFQGKGYFYDCDFRCPTGVPAYPSPGAFPVLVNGDEEGYKWEQLVGLIHSTTTVARDEEEQIAQSRIPGGNDTGDPNSISANDVYYSGDYFDMSTFGSHPE